MKEHKKRTEVMERQVLPEIDLLYRVALSITRSHADAEDLVQDTLLRAYRSIGSFDGKHPRAWLLTILRHAHINRNRRQRPRLLMHPDAALRRLASISDGSDQPERMVVDDACDASVAAAFRALPERYRKVVELVDIDGLSYIETSAVLSIPVGTVMSRLHRARARMKKQLVARGFTRGRERR